MWFSRIIWKNLLQRRLRTVMTCAGLAIAVAAMTSLAGVARSFGRAGVDFYATRGVDIVVVRAGVAERITSTLPAEFADQIARAPGVAQVAAGLTEMVSFGDGDLVGIPLRGAPKQGFALDQYVATSGRKLAADDHRAVLLGESLAEALKKKAGDTLAIEGTPFAVVGVFQASNPLETLSAVTLLDDLQQLMDRKGQVSEIQVRVDRAITSEAALAQVCHAIELLAGPSGEPLGVKALATRAFVASGSETRLMSAMALGASLVATALTLLGVLNTMWMSVLERTQEIGVLRAIGWSRSRIARMIVGESLLLATAGGVAGVLAAWLLTRALLGMVAAEGWLAAEIDPTATMLGFAAALVAALLGAMFPAWNATRIPAVEALRYE